MTPGKLLPERSISLALGLLLLTDTFSLAQGSLARSASKRSDEIWAAFDYSNSVSAFTTLASTGAVSAHRTIAGDRTGLRRPAAVALDIRDTLYVSNSGNNSVTVYAPGAIGNVAPVRTITGLATGLATPSGITLDEHGALYVTNQSRDRVTVYAPGADGNALPIRSIWGSRTWLRSPETVAIDRHGALYVTSHSMGYIAVFARGSNGNIPPVRLIRSTAYGPVGMKSLSWRGVAFPHAMTFDREGRLYVADWGEQSGPSIQLYPTGARGITASLRTINGDHTELDYPIGVTIDSGGFVYVLNQSTRYSITVYPPKGSGDATPLAKLSGDASGRARPSPWDSAGREAGDSGLWPPSAVAIYPSGASGNVAPDREITGERTGLHLPVTLKLTDDGTLYVLNCQGRVTVYASDAQSDAAPIRDFGRVPPGPSSPSGLALDRRDTAFISIARYDESFRLGWTDVYGPSAAADSAPQRRIDFFASKRNGLALDSRDYLYFGLGEIGFVIRHKSRVVRPIPAGEKPEGPDADPSTPGVQEDLFLKGPDDELFRPGAFDLDSQRWLYVPNWDDAVRVYPTAKGGPLRPLRTIAGPRTELDEPAAVALGPGDTLFVANVGSARGSSITVYPPNARGNVPPIRTLRGPRTRLGPTGALAVDGVGRLHVLRKSPPAERCPARDS
jgi:sugar lactone lactonase YvrE